MPPRRQDPPYDTDEPYVRRWPGAVRLIVLVLAAIGAWGIVIVLGWLVWRRLMG